MATYRRNLIVWGDHSSLLSSGVLVYTVKVIFSKRIFLTNKEVLEKTGKTINVQSLVEQPHIYIFAHCGDTIANKLSYVSLRREDILEMQTPLIATDGTILNDTMRFFQGLLATSSCVSLFLFLNNKNNKTGHFNFCVIS